MTGESQSQPSRSTQLEPRIFWPGLLIVLVLSILLAAMGDTAQASVEALFETLMAHFGWLYLLTGIGGLVFLLWLALGRYGRIKLGAPDDEPEFSTLNWIARLFCAGIGIAIVNWAFVESIYFLGRPPFGVEPNSEAAAEWAIAYAQFHWGLIPWALYALPAIPIAYSLYVRRLPGVRFSTASEGVLGQRAQGWMGYAMDVLVVFSTVGGVGTSLGLAVPLVSALCSELFGVGDSFALHLGILALWTAIFSVSVYKGLDRGIKRLSDFNVVFALALLLFTMVVSGGTAFFILSMWTNSMGLLIGNFFRMSFWLDPVAGGGFPQDWTIFYWAWWIAYAPMMGLFVARISRGRTIRAVLLGEIFWGAAGCWVFFAVWGGYAVHLEINGLAPVAEALHGDGIAAAVIVVLRTLPFADFVLAVFTALCFVFLATTLDSAAYTLASASTKELTGYQEPARWNRLLWAFVLALVAVGLLGVGGLRAVQISTIVGALPMIPILLVLLISLMRWLREDFGGSLAQPALALEQKEGKARVVECDPQAR